FPLLLLDNPNLFAEMPEGTLRTLLACPRVQEGALTWAARHKRESLRASAAQNPSAPQEVLTRLAADASPDVRAEAPRNPAAAPLRAPFRRAGSLEDLKPPPAPAPALPPEALAPLAALGGFGASLAARHPRPPAEVLDRLASTSPVSPPDLRRA